MVRTVGFVVGDHDVQRVSIQACRVFNGGIAAITGSQRTQERQGG